MADSTALPSLTELYLGQWSNKDAPEPVLNSPISATDKVLTVSAPLKDEDGSIVTKAFLLGLKKENNWVECCLVTSGTLDYDAQTGNFTVGQILTGGTSGAKARIVEDTDGGSAGTLNLILISGTFQDNETITDSATGSATVNGVLINSVSADGLTLSNVIRGIDPGGLDFTVGSAAFADTHDQDEPIFCNIPAVIPEMIRSVVQGLLATGGSGFILGTDQAGTVIIKRSTGVGTSEGFLRWSSSSNKTEFSNDGSTWVAIDDTVSSVLFKISSGDTTPGYGENKIQGGAGITITKKNTGGNEHLEITTNLAPQISAPATYTPAYLTGGTGAQNDPALWDSISNGSFRATINGVAYNVDGIDFTPQTGGDMDDMAGVIQAAIRSATGSTETVVWSTDHFVLTSVNTTSSSGFSVLTTSTGTVGTDISGAGGSDWMDADSGNGTETAAVLDQTQDANKIPLLGATGELDILFLPSNDLADIVNKYGNGEDGDVVISGNTTLTSNKNYNNLTINSGITLNPGGFTIAVKNNLTYIGTGKIALNGSNGGNGVNYGSTGAGGTAAAANGTGVYKTMPGANGGDGGSTQDTDGSNGSAGVSANTLASITVANSGRGGDAGLRTGGSAGANGTATALKNGISYWPEAYAITGLIRPAPSSGGGGGGSNASGSGATAAAGGGASGNSGGIVLVFAKNIITVNATAYIEAKGGDGGDGGDGFDTTKAPGGGGAGGAGGVVVLVYRTKTGGGTIDVSGGSGGSAGSWSGSGQTNGANGPSGATYSIQT